MLYERVVILEGKWKGLSMWVTGLTKDGMLLVASSEKDEPFKIHPQNVELYDREDLWREQLEDVSR